MKTKNRGRLGLILMVVGVSIIIMTIGRVDWEDKAVNLKPEDIIPFWQIVLQAGLGLGFSLIGWRLRKVASRTEEMIARINWNMPQR